MNGTEAYQKRGYLREKFRLFHLRDVGAEELSYHYHEFDKLVIFLSGSASYIIEGRSYFLQPWDVLLVSHHLIHKPVIDPRQPYERVVIYLDPDFLEESSGRDPLNTCFRTAEERRFALMRMGGDDLARLQVRLARLEEALAGEDFGADLLARTCFLQLLIHLNQVMLRDRTDRRREASRHDPKIAQALDYINSHLDQPLTVDQLAGLVYSSKYHFMRRFKELTGVSVHRYVSEKRLLAAAGLLRQGVPAQAAALRCGFQDYSTFQRAFKRQFQATPRAFSDHGPTPVETHKKKL